MDAGFDINNQVYKQSLIPLSSVGSTVIFKNIYYDGSTNFGIANVVTVPAKTTLVALDKNASIYLEEGCQLKGGASANSDLEAVITYDEIS